MKLSFGKIKANVEKVFRIEGFFVNLQALTQYEYVTR